MDVITLLIPFVIGLSSMACGCTLPTYPGLFAFLQRNVEKSRLRTFALSLTFSSGIVLILIGLGAFLGYFQTFTAQTAALGSSATETTPSIQLNPASVSLRSSFKFIGAALSVGIGAVFLLNLECRLTPSVAARLPVNLQGFRGAALAGLFYGGPGAITCSFIFLLPFIFLSLVAGDMQTTILQFASFGIGRTILIVILGMMMAGLQIRLVKLIAGKSRAVSVGVGLVLIVFGQDD